MYLGIVIYCILEILVLEGIISEFLSVYHVLNLLCPLLE